MISEDTIRKSRLATMGIYGVALLGLLAATQGGKKLSGASIAIGLLAVSGLFVSLISYVRAWRRGHRWETVRGYFRDVQIMFTHMTLGMLCIYCTIFLGRGGQFSEVSVWYLLVIVAIAVHQFVRAGRRVTAKWRTLDDVVLGLYDSAATAERFSAKYDMGFFIGVSILTSIMSRFVGVDPVLLVGGVLGVLAFPWVLGSTTYQRAVIARLLPNDMALSDWYTFRSAPHTPDNIPARDARQSRHTTPARRDTSSRP